MRVLFVHEINWWKKVIYEIHELPELLSIRGHEVTLIDFPENSRPRGFARLFDFRTNIATNVHRAYKSGSIEVRTPGRVLASPFDRIVASITFVPLLYRTLKGKRPDVIVLYGVPTNGWQAIVVARMLKIPVLFRAIDVSHALRKSVFKFLILKAEKFIYRKANAISANNLELAKYCISLGANPDIVSVDYPGMDIELLKPMAKDTELRRRLGIHEHEKVVVYMGTFFRFSGLDAFLNLFASHLTNSNNVKLLLIGGGEAEHNLRCLVEDLQINDSVIFTGFVDYLDLPKYLSLADVAINTFPSTLVTDCALPSKVLQYLCCGIPTVATPVKGLRGLIPDGNGVIYRELDPSFTDAVVDLLTDNNPVAMKKIARDAALSIASWNTNLAVFEDLLSNVAYPR